MTDNFMYYSSTNIEVKLGDRINYKKLFGKKEGEVVYVPEQSKKNSNLEYGDVQLWAIQLNDDESIIQMPYFLEEDNYTNKRIEFVSRSEPKNPIQEAEPIE